MKDQYLSASKVAELLHVTPQSVRRYCNTGQLPYVTTLGGHRRIKRADLDIFIGNETASETSKTGGIKL